MSNIRYAIFVEIYMCYNETKTKEVNIMNSSFNVIPTPKRFEYKDGGGLKIKSIGIVGEKAVPLPAALDILKKDLPFTLTEGKSDLTLYVGEENFPKELVTKEVNELFEECYANAQGYVINGDGGGKAVILAKSSQGAAYGLMTIRQLLGAPIGSFTILDTPDFRGRGIKWLVWAETGAWSYDYGDGVEAIKKRMVRKLDTLLAYKINSVYADGYGFDTERFEGYADIMRTLSDEARRRGIKIGVGGYSMSYGMVGHLNSYQGKHFFNRKSYPDGEIYECIGTHDPRITGDLVKARDRGTCLSNEELFKLKMDEIKAFLKKTHVTSISLHNMDADEIHEGLWLARCPECRKRWPSDSLFTKDGCAGAFAEFIDKIMDEVRSVKDGDYDAERDLSVSMSGPGYLYYNTTADDVFDKGIEFWGSVADHLENPKGFSVGFREQFFYHCKAIPRVTKVKERIKNALCGVGNFQGCDGFYDDKLFTSTGALNYILKGYNAMTTYNGNSFQEPLAIFDAEYMWNSESSAFYNIPERPKNYEEYLELYKNVLKGKVKPEEIYGEGGFIDVICEKLYGKEVGKYLSRVYKASGKNGEPPILAAASVDIYTNYSKVTYPMRWDDEITEEKEREFLERFTECAKASGEAYRALDAATSLEISDGGMREDLEFLKDCAYMGKNLTELLSEYMGIYIDLATAFRKGVATTEDISTRLESLRRKEADFSCYVNGTGAKPLDRFEGPFIRRREMAEWLEYNTELMKKSIAEGKRIPTDRKPLRTRDWW